MTIVPRWEWRTFGELDPFTSISPGNVEDREEQYLLTPSGDASVKVRDGLMDVKRLLDVDEAGLECWTPVLKAPFPLGGTAVEVVLTALGERIPATLPDELGLDELLALAGPRVRLVEVRKRREHYVIDGCQAEHTELRVDARTTHTVAIEAEDPARVRAVLGRLGLSSRANTCVARGLKALTGIGACRFAAIDVGTNSVKFRVGERAADGTWRAVVDRAEVTQLGERLEPGGRLHPEAIARTAAAIAGMVAEAERHKVEAITAVGTAGLRAASNASDLAARAGVPVEVISGDEEARLAYRAATAELEAGSGSLVVFDTGGGSSQFSFGLTDRVDERFSVDVGAIRLTERYGLAGVTPLERLESALAAIGGGLVKLAGRARPDMVIGMGGATTNLAAVSLGLEDYDPDVVHGTVLDRDEIDRQIELYRSLDREQRQAIAGLQPARAEVILAGALVVRVVLMSLGVEALTVSDRGLRHGLLADRYSLGSPARSEPVAAA